MPLTFSDLSLVSLAFEVRYPDAYLLWDRAGQVANHLRLHSEISRLTSAEPGKIAFKCVSGDVTWELERLGVEDQNPASSTLDEFYRLCDECLGITTALLEVEELTRVGFRPIFAKNFGSKAEAAGQLLATGLFAIPTGKQFNVDALHTIPEFMVRRDGEKFGYRLKLSVEELKYEFNPPANWRGGTVAPRTEPRLTFDIDWYTLAPMAVGTLKAKDWLSDIMHAIRRDSDRFFGR